MSATSYGKQCDYWSCYGADYEHFNTVSSSGRVPDYTASHLTRQNLQIAFYITCCKENMEIDLKVTANEGAD
jgi:hypothetical protein